MNFLYLQLQEKNLLKLTGGNRKRPPGVDRDGSAPPAKTVRQVTSVSRSDDSFIGDDCTLLVPLGFVVRIADGDSVASNLTDVPEVAQYDDASGEEAVPSVQYSARNMNPDDFEILFRPPVLAVRTGNPH